MGHYVKKHTHTQKWIKIKFYYVRSCSVVYLNLILVILLLKVVYTTEKVLQNEIVIVPHFILRGDLSPITLIKILF